VNALVWLCLKQAPIRGGRINALAQAMKKQDAEFWAPALTVLKSIDLRKKPMAEVDAAMMAECDGEFQAVLDKFSEREYEELRIEHAGFLRYCIGDAVQRGDLVRALEMLDRLEKTAYRDVEATGRLRELLDRRLQMPSHEKAYALIDRDPDGAREIWLDRLRMIPGEHASLEHLACLAWDRAFERGAAADAAREKAEQTHNVGEQKILALDAGRDYEAAISYFVEGIEYFRQLYGDETYWDVLEQKGRQLETTKNPFDQGAFDAWRQSALKEQAKVLVDFAVYVANQDKKEGTSHARSALARLRNCDLPKELVQGLIAEFSRRMLDSDPTVIAQDQFVPAMARAERVLQIDPDNLHALEFLVCGHTYRAGISKGEEEGTVAERIGSVQSKAERLEQLMMSMDADGRKRATRQLSAFWEMLGKKSDEKSTKAFLTAKDSDFDRRLMPEVRKWTEAANRAFEHAVRLDSSVSLRTAKAQETNNKLLENMREAGY
jgi:hypothetical protein